MTFWKVSLSCISQYMSEKLKPLSPAMRLASLMNLKIAFLSPEAKMSLKVSKLTSSISLTTLRVHSFALATTLSPMVMLLGNCLNVPGSGK